MVIDIKGIGGFPSDDDCRQSEKHATMLMREEKRTNINGLSIINHQRHLAPIARDNALPFRKEIVEYALESQVGLLTTWDLYRIVRNFFKNQWTHEHVRPIFYKHGHINALPAHYQYLGIVAKVFTGKFGIVISEGEIKKDDRFAVEFEVLYEEQTASTLMVDNVDANSAGPGDKTGLPWASQMKLKEGQKVFLVRNFQ